MRPLPDDHLLHRYQTPAALRAERNRPVLRAMLRLLPDDQRRLAEMVLLNHASHRAAAAWLRVSPGAVTRRVHSLRNRLACPLRRTLVLHLASLPEPTRGIAVEHYFAGLSRAALAKAFDLSHREIGHHLDYVRGWLRALNRQRRAQIVRDTSLPREVAPPSECEPVSLAS